MCPNGVRIFTVSIKSAEKWAIWESKSESPLTPSIPRGRLGDFTGWFGAAVGRAHPRRAGQPIVMAKMRITGIIHWGFDWLGILNKKHFWRRLSWLSAVEAFTHPDFFGIEKNQEIVANNKVGAKLSSRTYWTCKLRFSVHRKYFCSKPPRPHLPTSFLIHSLRQQLHKSVRIFIQSA